MLCRTIAAGLSVACSLSLAGFARAAAAPLPVEDDAVSGPFVAAYLARVYVAAGRHDRATALLERLMKTDSWFTPAELRADPIWEPLRGYPAFRRLTETALLSSRLEGS